jgi:hypothetical protein
MNRSTEPLKDLLISGVRPMVASYYDEDKTINKKVAARVRVRMEVGEGLHKSNNAITYIFT